MHLPPAKSFHLKPFLLFNLKTALNRQRGSFRVNVCACGENVGKQLVNLLINSPPGDYAEANYIRTRAGTTEQVLLISTRSGYLCSIAQRLLPYVRIKDHYSPIWNVVSAWFTSWLLSWVRFCACGQTYPFRFLIWEDAALSTRREVAVNLEGVPRAALVGINPVLAWKNEERQKSIRLQSGMYYSAATIRSFRLRWSFNHTWMWVSIMSFEMDAAFSDFNDDKTRCPGFSTAHWLGLDPSIHHRCALDNHSAC